jgi:hypothetical protein
VNDDKEARAFIAEHHMTTPSAYDDLTQLLSRARNDAAPTLRAKLTDGGSPSNETLLIAANARAERYRTAINSYRTAINRALTISDEGAPRLIWASILVDALAVDPLKVKR